MVVKKFKLKINGIYLFLLSNQTKKFDFANFVNCSLKEIHSSVLSQRKYKAQHIELELTRYIDYYNDFGTKNFHVKVHDVYLYILTERFNEYIKLCIINFLIPVYNKNHTKEDKIHSLRSRYSYLKRQKEYNKVYSSKDDEICNYGERMGVLVGRETKFRKLVNKKIKDFVKYYNERKEVVIKTSGIKGWRKVVEAHYIDDKWKDAREQDNDL